MQAWLSSIYRAGIRTLQGPGDYQGSDQLGDFTTTRRVVWLSAMAIVLGMISAFLALALLRLIGLFTNLFFFQRLDTSLISPANHMLGLWALFVPVVGALSIGCMAPYGSERIRGHGIPEPSRPWCRARCRAV